MLRTQRLLANRERTLVECFCLLVLAPLTREGGQPIEWHGYLRVLWTQGLFTNVQGSLIERLRLVVLALLSVEFAYSGARKG